MEPTIIDKFREEVVLPYDRQRKRGDRITYKQMIGDAKNGHDSELSPLCKAIRDGVEVDERLVEKYYRIVMRNCVYEDGVLRLQPRPPVAPAPAPVAGFRSHPSLPAETIMEEEKRTRGAGGLIQIIDTYVNHLLPAEDEDRLLDLVAWAEVPGRRIEILVLDPLGQAFRLRAGRLPEQLHILQDRVLKGLERLLELQRNTGGRLQVRLYDEIPAFSGILFGQAAFIGMYFALGHSQRHTQFEIREDSGTAFQHLKEHFTKMWEHSVGGALQRKLLDDLRRRFRKSMGPDFMHGLWRVFFNDPRAPIPQPAEPTWENRVLGQVTEAILDLRISGKQQTSAILQLPESEPMACTVDFEKLGVDYDFVRVQCGDGARLHVSLFVRCRPEPDDRLFGTYTMLFDNQLVSGALVLISTKNEEAQAHSHNPLGSFEINTELLQLLAVKDQVTLAAGRLREAYHFHKQEKDNLHRVKGVYELYSYARNGRIGEKEIAVNIIEIFSYGYVRFKSQNGRTAQGTAVRKGENIHIQLSYTTDPDRTGYLILYASDLEANEERLYGGVFLGLTRTGKFPVGLRFVLRHRTEKFEQLEPRRIALHSPEYEQIPAGIRQACTGRLLNMVGFFRQYGQIFNDNSLQNECRRSIQIDDLFFHSACFECHENRKDAALHAILRAFNNGFTRYEDFEEKVGNTPAGKEVVRNPEYQKWRRKISDTRGREEV